jgi:hypothetical protein
VVVLGSEIGNAMTITSIGFKPTSGTSALFDELSVYMGPASGSVLVSNFEDNYSGDRLLVYSKSGVLLSVSGGWVTLPLDTPYFYSGSGNLIIEIAWPNGDLEIYTGYWGTSGNRTMTAFYGSPTGDLYDFCPNLLLSGSMSLTPMTFGAIKASF